MGDKFKPRRTNYGCYHIVIMTRKMIIMTCKLGTCDRKI